MWTTVMTGLQALTDHLKQVIPFGISGPGEADCRPGRGGCRFSRAAGGRLSDSVR
ncbi:MAG: hypothetical protein Ct9H300mP1_18690 [Planctomycetaceae bacterium]|nr:MAG: hypothetical protein Ct9H300mP1_18690 [Planctomycetaceae bacterium]